MSVTDWMTIDESEIVLSLVMILYYFTIMMRRNTRQVISLKEFIRWTKNKTIQEYTFFFTYLIQHTHKHNIIIKNDHYSIYNEIPAAYYVLYIFKSFRSHCRHPTDHFSNSNC